MTKFRLEASNTPDSPVEFDGSALFNYMSSTVSDFPYTNQYAQSVLGWAVGEGSKLAHPFVDNEGHAQLEIWTRLPDSEA